VWSGEIEDCIHQNHVFRARLHAGFDPKFVSWHGNTFGREWFERHGRQTTNLASLNLTTLKAFPVPVPPLEEQRRIVAEVEARLSVLDTLRGAIERAQRRSASLRCAVLERAFRGELESGRAGIRRGRGSQRPRPAASHNSSLARSAETRAC
jgi:type I restriction enzyme S subunit